MFRLGHRPGLDTLRGVAVILVLVGHARVPGLVAGGMSGVTLFFVLSGFLITRLLVEERSRFGSIDLRAFYGRRAIRLLPALFAILAVLILFGAQTWQETIPIIGYYGNVALVWLDNNLGLMGHTWSLALEEQFYLLWPIALVFFRRPTKPLIVVVMVAWTVRVFAPEYVVHYDILSRSDGIAIGALMALTVDSWLPWVRRWMLPAGAAMALVAATNVSGLRVGLMLATVGSVMLVAGALEHQRVRFEWFGKRSYALYLWHLPLYFLWGPVGVIVSLGASEISWRLIEHPMQARWRKQFVRPQPRDVSEEAVSSNVEGVSS